MCKYVKYVTKLIALIFVVCIGVLSILGCGNPCPTDQRIVMCEPDIISDPHRNTFETTCCYENESGDSCCLMKGFGRYVNGLSQLSKPDLSYSTLDGLVDLGQTKLRVEIPSDNDYFETQLKGRVAIVEKDCPTPQCLLEVSLVELRPIEDHITTIKGRSISGLFVRNANIWKGYRSGDGTIILDSNSNLAIEAIVDGEYKLATVAASSEIKGVLYYNTTRMTSTGARVNNNKIMITGNFAGEDVKVSLSITIWATNCEPVVKPTVRCMPGIELGERGYLSFDSDFRMLGNLQSSQDICDALLTQKYEDICTSGKIDEFPTFSCKKQPLPSTTDPTEIAKLLKFRWQDANGNILSKQYKMNLDQMPEFPVTLSVENKWGRVVSAKINEPAQSENCPIEKIPIQNLAIQGKYEELGGVSGFLGQPLTKVKAGQGNGYYQEFQGGTIYWLKLLGSHEVHGAILNKYKGLGAEASFLSYPETDETKTPDSKGRFNHFQGGSIYWTADTGAHEVHGAIRDKWKELGWEKSVLGYPITDEMKTPDGTKHYSQFQGGTIYWYLADGHVEVKTKGAPPPQPPQSSTGGITGAFFFDTLGTQPFSATAIFNGNLISPIGTSGQTTFSEKIIRTITPGGIQSIGFSVEGLMKGNWSVTASSNFTGSITCKVNVPPGHVQLKVAGGNPSCSSS